MQAVFSEIIFSNNDSSKTAVIFGRKLRDLPLSLARSWMEVLPFHCIYSVGFEDPVEKEIRAFYRKQKLRRVGRIGATLVILAYSLSKPTIAGSVYRKAKFTLEGSPIGCVSLVWQVQGNLHLQSIFWATTQ
jgi:hypothetical protein